MYFMKRREKKSTYIYFSSHYSLFGSQFARGYDGEHFTADNQVYKHHL